MSDDRDDDLLRDIWKEQKMHVRTPDIEDLRDREQRLESWSTWRNRIEYIAGGIAITLLGVAGAIMLTSATTLGSTVSGIGHLAVAAALLWVLVRLFLLQRTARADVPGRPILEHLRARLMAERDMLRGAWAWYVAPLVPGFALIYGGIAIEPNPNWWVFWTGTLVTAAVVIWIAWLNRRAADRLSREIDRLGDEEPTS